MTRRPGDRPARRALRRASGMTVGMAIAAAVLLAGCTGGGDGGSTPEPSDVTITSTVTATRSPAPAYDPPAAKNLPYLADGAAPHKDESEKSCPYIRTGLQLDPTDEPNVAAIEGSRIYRATVVTTTTPVGCRFYFWSAPYYATTEILPRTFATAQDAHNAMVLTAQKQGTQLDGKRDIVPGVDAVLFRTKFFDQDDGQDWACAFAKGPVMVVIRTARTDTSQNALLLAQAIADKF